MRAHPYKLVRMLECLDQIFRRSLGKVRYLELFRLLVLHTPDAAEMMIAVGTNGSIVWPVLWTARVVVNHCLIIEIQNIERTVRTNAMMNRTEPQITAGDEFRFLVFARNK